MTIRISTLTRAVVLLTAVAIVFFLLLLYLFVLPRHQK